jgi:hypothetical protein
MLTNLGPSSFGALSDDDRNFSVQGNPQGEEFVQLYPQSATATWSFTVAS